MSNNPRQSKSAKTAKSSRESRPQRRLDTSQAPASRRLDSSPTHARHASTSRSSQNRDARVNKSQPTVRKASSQNSHTHVQRNPQSRSSASTIPSSHHQNVAHSNTQHSNSTFKRRAKLCLTVCMCVFIAIVLFICIDSLLTSGKVLKGVHVGDVDVSNMTEAEAAHAIAESYEPKLYATTVYIFADEQTAQSEDLDLKILETDSLAEQLSFEEAQKNKKLWMTSAEDLEASIPSEELAKVAVETGKGGGISERLSTSISGRQIDVYASFNEMSLSNLISDINSSLGYEMHDYGIQVEKGKAKVLEGNDGYMLDNAEFSNTLSNAFLKDESPIVGFVADIKYTPMRIDEEAAKKTCDMLNVVIPQTVTFNNNNKDIDIWHDTVLDWVKTRVVDLPYSASSSQNTTQETAQRYYLEPYIDISVASPSLISFIEEGSSDNNVDVEYIFEGDNVYVKPASDVTIPKVDESLESLDYQLFSGFRDGGDVSSQADVEDIAVQTYKSSDNLSLSDAISYGVVDAISTFTTRYTNTSSTAARTFNVHHAADILNNSIAKAKGGLWSFNEIVGHCDEENGFKEAKIIESGEYTTGIGGGICQVATTVFNAAYEAGLPIKERHNHSLHSSSYPAGRDAAIAYPNYDLKWENDTDADILLRASYTDTSLTVTLIGTDPKREVTTDVGEWIEGKKHGLKFEIDDAMAANSAYIKTAGTDGMEITISRTVKDSDGKIIISDAFTSSYAPITKVVVCGEGSDMAQLRTKYGEDD